MFVVAGCSTALNRCATDLLGMLVDKYLKATYTQRNIVVQIRYVPFAPLYCDPISGR
jgi:hypothetical protein